MLKYYWFSIKNPYAFLKNCVKKRFFKTLNLRETNSFSDISNAWGLNELLNLSSMVSCVFCFLCLI